MKRFKWFLMAMCLAVMPALQSCNDDEGYSVGDFTPPLWATVRTTGNTFYLDCDVWGTLWIASGLPAGNYIPADGQRVVTVFNPLWDEYQGYDHAVKLLALREVLTKEVETPDAENEEELGDDPVLIYKGDITVSGGYLNIAFMQNLPAAHKHRISLVRPAADDELYDADGYLCLTLRYNNYDDLTGRRAYGLVSFNLSSLNIDPTAKGIKLKLNSEVNGAVEATFDFRHSDDNLAKLQDLDVVEKCLQ